MHLDLGFFLSKQGVQISCQAPWFQAILSSAKVAEWQTRIED
jgi:hypothetical protein